MRTSSTRTHTASARTLYLLTMCAVILHAMYAQPLRAQATSQQPPRLVVMITADQLTQSYLDRYGPEFDSGLRRLLDRGAVFERAYHDHAITQTAPGHASLLSGRFPRSTGILSNAAGVPDPHAPLIGSRSTGASPFRFRGSVLMDWMRMADPASRGLSVSRKDRGAILPFGRSHEPAYWYASGRFTTSSWFADTLPAWVQQFNERRIPHAYAGRSWTLVAPETQYSERDSVPIESGGTGYTFPHALPVDSTQAAAQLVNFPFMDEVILAFALDGMRARQLGADDHPDLLAVSFSTTDAVGHEFGPDSREIHDQLLRLDRVIGQLIDSVFARVDSSRVVFALSSDHGVTPFPELHNDSAAAAAMHVNVNAAVAAFRAEVAPHGIDSVSVLWVAGSLKVTHAALRRSGYDITPALQRFISTVRAQTGVADAQLVGDLPRLARDNMYARRWLHMLPPDGDVRAVVSPKPGHVWGRSRDASHGSPGDTDAHVPIIFYGGPFTAARIRDFVRTVDIGPTLAAALGVAPTEALDGVVLRAAFLRR